MSVAADRLVARRLLVVGVTLAGLVVHRDRTAKQILADTAFEGADNALRLPGVETYHVDYAIDVPQFGHLGLETRKVGAIAVDHLNGTIHAQGGFPSVEE